MPLREVFCLTLFGCSLAQGQLLMEGLRPGGPSRLRPGDAAILDGQEPRKDLPCEVKADNPLLEYDLRFHAGYRIAIPLRAMGRGSTTLSAILQVTPEGSKEPVYFSQNWTVPPLAEGARGVGAMQGTFAIGEGNYRVALLARDPEEHLCASFWQISALRRGKDRDVVLPIAPGAVEPASRDPFRQEEPVQRDNREPLRVLFLMHVDPEGAGGAQIGVRETQSMASILRGFARDRRFARFSVTAFSIEQRAVVFRQKDTEQIEFPALGRALSELHPGTISVQTLGENDGGTRFLADLFAEDLTHAQPDLVVIMGPHGPANNSYLGNFLKQIPHPACPVFYLNYSGAPDLSFYRDLLGSVVKFWNGTEYIISSPRDAFVAWSGVYRQTHEAGRRGLGTAMSLLK